MAMTERISPCTRLRGLKDVRSRNMCAPLASAPLACRCNGVGVWLPTSACEQALLPETDTAQSKRKGETADRTSTRPPAPLKGTDEDLVVEFPREATDIELGCGGL